MRLDAPRQEARQGRQLAALQPLGDKHDAVRGVRLPFHLSRARHVAMLLQQARAEMRSDGLTNRKHRAPAADSGALEASNAMVRVDALRKFPEVVTRLGGDPNELLAKVQIDPAILNNRHAVIPYRSLCISRTRRSRTAPVPISACALRPRKADSRCSARSSLR